MITAAEITKLAADWDEQESGRVNARCSRKKLLYVSPPYRHSYQVKIAIGESLPYLPDERLIAVWDLLQRPGWTARLIMQLLPNPDFHCRILKRKGGWSRMWLLTHVVDAENTDEFIAANCSRTEPRKIADWCADVVFAPPSNLFGV